ncbi:MAG: hypothetical protein AB8H80_14470 [Planctomycetota bacterium]
MIRSAALALCLTAPAVAQSPIACFEFDGASLASTGTPLASVSDLVISNPFMFGGPGGNSWLCLTTAWNGVGGTISFTVTPAANELLDFSSLEWQAVTNNASVTDSVRAVTIFANGSALGTIDPLTHLTNETLDVSGVAGLQGVGSPVTFVLDFVGNPTGQSAYEVDSIKLFASACEPSIGGVSPASLPTVPEGCFTLTGECFADVTEVRFGGDVLPVCDPSNFGKGCYEIVDGNTIKVCPPLCESPDAFAIELLRANGETASANVSTVLSVDGALACPSTHPAGTEMCVYVSSGELPQPSAIFIIISPSNSPSVIPGVVSMGLGDMLQNYVCGPGYLSACVEECYMIPPALAGQTYYFQSIVLNAMQMTFPLPVTNLCSTTFQ